MTKSILKDDGITSQESVRPLRTQKQTPEEIEERILATMEMLRAEIAAKCSVRICELSRRLASQGVHAFRFPKVWTADRVKEAHDLLEKSVNVTVGTPYQENCATRPQEFMSRL